MAGYDAQALMAPITEAERFDSRGTVERVMYNQMSERVDKRGPGHTTSSLAVLAAGKTGSNVARGVGSGIAIARLERAEAMRAADIRMLTTIDRARMLMLDGEMMRMAGEVKAVREGGGSARDVSLESSARVFGHRAAEEMANALHTVKDASLAEIAGGRGVSDPLDAVRAGSVLVRALDRPNPVDRQIAKAMDVGVSDALSLTERLRGAEARERIAREKAIAAPGREREAMIELERREAVWDETEAARREAARPAALSRHGSTYESPIPDVLYPPSDRVADFTDRGPRLEQRIAAETRMLAARGDEELRREFREVMPGRPPADPERRSAWVEGALRNEHAMVASSTAPTYVSVAAVMRERGPIPPASPESKGRLDALPSGSMVRAAFQDSRSVADNLARVDDMALRRRFGSMPGMDASEIPPDADARRSWISTAARLEISWRNARMLGMEQPGASGSDRPMEAERERQAPRPAMSPEMMRAVAMSGVSRG